MELHRRGVGAAATTFELAEHAPANPRGTSGCRDHPASLSAHLQEKMDAMSGRPGPLTFIAARDTSRREHSKYLATVSGTAASIGVLKAELVDAYVAQCARPHHAEVATVLVLVASCLRRKPLQVYTCIENRCDKSSPDCAPTGGIRSPTQAQP